MTSSALLPLLTAVPKLGSTVRIVAVIATAIALGIVLELVRRRRLVERYALLWMVVGVVLVVLAVWTELLSWLTRLVGIHLPANFLFLTAFGVGFVLLLHFSVAISRLSEETKILAQEVARLDLELRAARGEDGAGHNGAEPPLSAAQDREDRPPVRAQD
jgi:hypothetical protein